VIDLNAQFVKFRTKGLFKTYYTSYRLLQIIIMNHKKTFVIAILGWISALFMGKVHAQVDSNYFSLKQCIAYASQNNSNIIVAKYDEAYGLKQIREIKGRALPQANINGNFEDRLKIPLLIVPGFGGTGGDQGIKMGYKYNSMLSGEVTQMIIDPSFGIGLKAARQNTLLSQQHTRQISEETAYHIASYYYKVIVLLEQLKLLQTNKNSTQKILEVTTLQFRNGVAKEVDVKRLHVNINNLESQIRQATTNVEQAYNNLKFHLGMPLEQKIALSDTVFTFNENDVVAPTSEAGNRIEYKIGQTNLELQRLNIRNNIRGYYPTLTAYANYGYQGQGPDFGLFKTADNKWVDYTTSAIGLRLRVPVFDGLQRSARVQQSKIRTKQQEENLKLIRQNIQLEGSNSYSQYQNTIKRIEAEKANVALAEEVYQITQLEFREGVSTSTDLVEAELSLRQAQNVYTQSLLDLYIARLDHEKSSGNILNYLNSK
jgi:outer membrane protein